MRTLFRKNKYKVYLIDEFRSSCKCSKCDGGVCEKYMVRKNPRPKLKENKEKHFNFYIHVGTFKNGTKYKKMILHGLSILLYLL